mgnify:CR=1 FL=1
MLKTTPLVRGSFGGYLLPTKGFHVVGIFPCLVGTTHLLVGTLTPLHEVHRIDMSLILLLSPDYRNHHDSSSSFF